MKETVSPLMHNVLKWSDTLQKTCSICSKFFAASFLKCIWPFCNICIIRTDLVSDTHWQSYMFCRGLFKTLSNIYVEFFYFENSWRLLEVNYFLKKISKFINCFKRCISINFPGRFIIFPTHPDLSSVCEGDTNWYLFILERSENKLKFYFQHRNLSQNHLHSFIFRTALQFSRELFWVIP